MKTKPSFFTRTLNRLGFVTRNQFRGAIASVKRSYAGAVINRLTNDWSTVNTSADTEVRNDIAKLRARTRVLDRDNPYARKYFRSLENNVIGDCGIRLHPRLQMADGADLHGNPTFKFDKAKNKAVADAWTRWCKRQNCTVSKRMPFVRVEKIVARSAARDGAILAQKIRGPAAKNAFNFAVKLIEIDHLDYQYDVPKMANGNTIRMGIELNEDSEHIAYHLWVRHPGDYYSASAFTRIRVPASEIIYVALMERAEQTSAVPWITSAMLRFNNLDRYEEAELVAAREAACKGGFFKHSYPEGYQGDATDSTGNQISEMEPGMYEDLPMGTDFIPLDPKHPTDAFPFFTKAQLRAIASGCGISYNELANDLEGVNFSSLRDGKLSERDQWKSDQGWLSEEFHEQVFEEWLFMALLSNQIEGITMADLEDNTIPHEWIGRRWPWVDPEKEINAAITAIDNGLDSARRTIAEQGGAIEDIYDDIAADKELAEEKGLDFKEAETALAPTNKPANPKAKPDQG